MTRQQQEVVRWLLIEIEPTEVHHGDCIGADEQLHEIARSLGIATVVHPPTSEKKRAFCKSFTRRYEPKEYLSRNKDIVEESAMLIAAPDEREVNEVRRSGVWATVRYARKAGLPVLVAYPNGSWTIARAE